MKIFKCFIHHYERNDSTTVAICNIENKLGGPIIFEKIIYSQKLIVFDSSIECPGPGENIKVLLNTPEISYRFI